MRRYVSRARTPLVCLNAQYDSGYNVLYFISKQPASPLFHPPPLLFFSPTRAQLLLARQTGLLSCSYNSCIHTFRAYQRGLKRNYWGSCCTCTFLFFSRFSRSRPRRPHPPLPSFPLPFTFSSFSPAFVSTWSAPGVSPRG